MRVYVGKVFDDYVSGILPVYTPSYLDVPMGQYEQFAIQLVVDRVGGISPRINVLLQHSSDGRLWADKSDTPAIASANLTAGVTNAIVGSEASEAPSLAYARWLLRLEGTNPRGYVKLWVTGRGRSGRLARGDGIDGSGLGAPGREPVPTPGVRPTFSYGKPSPSVVTLNTPALSFGREVR